MTTGFRASRRGNGVGLTVLTDEQDRVLVLVILPKFWRKSAERVDICIPSASSDPNRTVCWFALHEGDGLCFEAPDCAWAKALGGLADKRSPATDDEDGTGGEDGESDPLWSRDATVAPRGDATPQADTEAVVKAFRDLQKLLHAHGLGLVEDARTAMDPWSMALVEIPELRPYVLDAFTQCVERQVARRRPQYVSVTEDLGAIRGRVLASGLFERKARRRLDIRCTHETLTDDHIVWQTIRAAVAHAIAHRDAAVQQRALVCGARLRDVAVVPDAQILASPRPRIPTTERDLQRTYEMALNLLRHIHHLHNTSLEGGFSLKWTTSELWEKLVIAALHELPGPAHVTPHPTLRLFDGVGNKQPDIWVSGSYKLLIDAKYKMNSNNPSMSDQYQMAAYAVRTGLATFLIRVTCPQEKVSGPRTFRMHLLNTDNEPSLSDTPGWTNGSEGPRVGWLGLPFPFPGETVVPPEGIECLEELLPLAAADR